ncbi:MAG: hypothetical protein ACKO8Q_10150 [Bacteroidota bacterium]
MHSAPGHCWVGVVCSAHYIFSQFYINEVTEHTDVRLEIQVKIDEAGTLAKKTIPIHLYP